MLSLRLIAPILSIAAILIGAVAHFRCEERILRSTLFLLTIPLFSLAWLTIWIGLNLYSGDREGVIVFCLANLTAAAVVLTRFQIRKQLLALPRAIRLSLGILAVISIAALSFLSLELPLAQNGGIKVLPKFSFIEILIIFLVLSVILFIFQKHGASLIVGTTSIALIGVASAFVASFRNSAILPGDLLVLGTAAAVAGKTTLIPLPPPCSIRSHAGCSPSHWQFLSTPNSPKAKCAEGTWGPTQSAHAPVQRYLLSQYHNPQSGLNWTSTLAIGTPLAVTGHMALSLHS